MSVHLPPPPLETEAEIMRLVVRTYPDAERQHEPAIRLALQLAWTAALAITAQLKETING